MFICFVLFFNENKRGKRFLFKREITQGEQAGRENVEKEMGCKDSVRSPVPELNS